MLFKVMILLFFICSTIVCGTPEEALCQLADKVSSSLSGWTCDPITSDVCIESFTKWEGVTCYHGAVSGISLNDKNLSGTISSSIGSLTGLELVSLHSNNLKGVIPRSMGEIISLKTLILYSNLLSGSIPLELCQTSLETMLIQDNMHLSCFSECLSSISGFDSGNVEICSSSHPSVFPTAVNLEHQRNHERQVVSNQIIIIVVVISTLCFALLLLGICILLKKRSNPKP